MSITTITKTQGGKSEVVFRGRESDARQYWKLLAAGDGFASGVSWSVSEEAPKSPSEVLGELIARAANDSPTDFPEAAAREVGLDIDKRASQAGDCEVARARQALAKLYAAYLTDGTLESLEVLDAVGCLDGEQAVDGGMDMAMGELIGRFAWEQAGRDLEEIFHGPDLKARWRGAREMEIDAGEGATFRVEGDPRQGTVSIEVRECKGGCASEVALVERQPKGMGGHLAAVVWRRGDEQPAWRGNL